MSTLKSRIAIVQRFLSRACVVVVCGQLLLVTLHVCRVVEDVYAYNSAFCVDGTTPPRSYLESLNPFRAVAQRNDRLASMPVSHEGRNPH